jgi:hypothetical protein
VYRLGHLPAGLQPSDILTKPLVGATRDTALSLWTCIWNGRLPQELLDLMMSAGECDLPIPPQALAFYPDLITAPGSLV